MSTWERLKQRKLVQWGVAYLAGAFALLQALQLVSQPFAWPDLVLKAAMVVLGVGFFAALVIAWYHGERGQQRVNTIELTMLTALLVIAGVAVAIVSRNGTEKTQTAAPAAAGTIAVLPFDNMSAQAENEYFSDGITEEILNVLAKVPGLQVAARTSSFQFKGKQVDIRDAAARLGVAHVLEGSVQRIDNQVKITAQLIDAKSGMHLWSETFTRELKDVFALEEEIANKIADALRTRLTNVGTAKVERAAVNPAAHDAYLQGRALFHGGDEPSLRRALSHFDRALALDSTLALAHAGIALTYLGLGDAYMVPREAYSRAGNAARRALALDPTLAEAHAALAYSQVVTERNLAKAIASAEHALELSPNSAEVIFLAANLKCFAEPGAGSLTLAERGVRLDPLSVPLQWNLEICKFSMGDYDGVIESHKKSTELAPNFAYLEDWAAAAYRAKGDYQAALREYQHLTDGGAGLYGLAVTYAKLGRLADAQKVIDQMVSASRQRYVPPSAIAVAYMHVGNLAEARRWTAKTEEVDDMLGTFLRNIPDFKPLTDDAVAGKILRDALRPR